MKIEDILAPWEYSTRCIPKLCEVYRFPLMWKGEKKLIIAGLIAEDPKGSNKYLAFRVAGEDASWIIGEENGVGTEKFSSKVFPSCSIVERRISAAFQCQSLYRQFAFTLNETPDIVWTATLSTFGIAYWTRQVAGTTNNHKTRFSFPVENLLESDVQILRDKLALELSKPDSDATYARNFFSLGIYPRRARLVGLKSESEIERFLKPIISLWKLAVNSYDYNGSHHTFVKSLVVRGDEEVNNLENLVIQALPPDIRLQFWAEIFIQHGLLPIDFPALNKYMALRDFFRKDGYQLATFVEALTSHERLEAKLKLLEWAKIHLPPAKYAEIEMFES